MTKKKTQELTNDEKVKLIEAKYSIKDIKPVNINDLSYTEKLYIFAIFRALTDESFNSILPLAEIDSNKLLSPNKYMDHNIFDCLYSKNIILVDPNSNIDSFGFEDNKCIGFKYNKINWLINIFDKDEEILSLTSCYSLIFKYITNYFPTSSEDRRKVLSFILNLAVHEALNYLMFKCSELNYELRIGKRVELYISQLITGLAVSNICSIIDRAVEEDYLYNSRSSTEKNYGSTVSDRILNLGELAIRDDSQIKHATRNECLPRSELSKIFYELIHGGSDQGFTECPVEYWNDKLATSYTAEE